MSCSEDVGYEPCRVVACPCKDCTGDLVSDGSNGHGTFLECNKCGHGYFAYYSTREKKKYTKSD